MSEVKWIKITTALFDSKTIKYIESLPDADAILVIWFKLLTLAGKCNARGSIYLTEQIPYTAEMLSNEFRRPIDTVKTALAIFERLEMIHWRDGWLGITNWHKYQNVEGLEKIRKQTRERVARHRERQKSSRNVTSNVTVTLSNGTDLEQEQDIDHDDDHHRNNGTTPATTDPEQEDDGTWEDPDWVKVAAVYNELTGRLESPLDVQAIKKTLKIATADQIIEMMREIYANYKPQCEGDGINSFSYFRKAITKAITRRVKGGGTGGTGRSSTARKVKEEDSEGKPDYSEYDNI